jgi:hypothetical protein
MLLGVRRRPRMLSASVWTAVALLVWHFALTAWYRANPYHVDRQFHCRFQQLRARLTSSEAVTARTIIMLGSSRTLNALHGRVIEKELTTNLNNPFLVHNFGMPGAGPAIGYVNLKRLLEQGVRPQLLLVEITPMLLNSRKSVKGEHEFVDPKRLLAQETAELAPYGWQPAKSEGWDRIAPSWYEFRETCTRGLADHWSPAGPQANVPVDAWGYSANWMRAGEAARRLGHHKARKGFEDAFSEWEAGGAPIEIFRLLLARCRREQIPVALAMMPEGPSAQGWYPADARARVRAFLDAFPASEDVPLIDAWSWLDDDDFSDGHHANLEGATKFSTRIVREYLLPWFRGDSEPHGKRTPFLTTSLPR